MASGVALVEIIRARPPARREVRVTVAQDAIPRVLPDTAVYAGVPAANAAFAVAAETLAELDRESG